MTARPDFNAIATVHDLARVEAKVDKLLQAIESATIKAQPEWVTIQEYAKLIGKSVDTVRRYRNAGRLETRDCAGTCMVRVNLGA
jgi:DNA-directed RNA polymerase specialized sigma24 family protein